MKRLTAKTKEQHKRIDALCEKYNYTYEFFVNSRGERKYKLEKVKQ